jgi:putative sigma-54 modulation protein
MKKIQIPENFHNKELSMEITIQSPSFHASEKLIDFAEDNVSKLGHYSDKIMNAQIVLRTDKSDTKTNKLCEIILSVRGNDLFASERCNSFEDVILNTVDRLKQQLISWKERTQNRSHPTANIVQPKE